MKKQKLLSILLGLLAVFCLPRTALAYDLIPELGSGLCSLTVTSAHGGVTYDAYQVCEVDQRARFTPCGAFAAEEIAGSVELLIQSGSWDALTDTLDTWLAGRGVVPDATVTTGEDGKGVFENLDTGLYLVRGREYLTSAGYYIPKSFMICLPNWVEAEDSDDGGTGEWVYDVAAQPKGSLPDNELTARSVLKIWRGDGSTARPTQVTAQLLRTDRATGETVVEDTVVLNGRNGWDHLWPELDNVNYTWTVQEVDVPGDYDVVYRQDGINVVITNYFSPDDPKHDDDPDPPDDPDDPDDPNNPDDPNDPNNPPPPDGPPNVPGEELEDPPIPTTNPPTEEDPHEPWEPSDEEDITDPDTPLSRLPQTGVLWWPVPILAIGGMFLFIVGWALNRRERAYED